MTEAIEKTHCDDTGKESIVRFPNFFNPALRLGAVANATEIKAGLNVHENVTLTYSCENFWELTAQVEIKQPDLDYETSSSQRTKD